MPDSGTIEIPKKTFEELVTKSSRWDEVLKLGYASAVDIKREHDDLTSRLKVKDEELRKEKLRADENWQEYKNLLATAAKALGTVQQPLEVVNALDKVEGQLDQLSDLERQYAALQLSSQEQLEELKVEVDRLKAVVKYGDLKDFTLEEILGEIIKRLKNILQRK
jgi:hypothetical protein